MNLRLQTLQRQRELLSEHLRWLDAEIAAVVSSPDGVQRPLDPAPGTRTSTSAAPTSMEAALPRIARGDDASESAAREMMPEIDKTSIHDEVKRGCFIYAAIAFAGFAAVVAAAYWMR